MQTRPWASRRTLTRFGTVCPATKFRFDAFGNDASHGYTVANPAPPGWVTVTFATTAVAPDGTPPRPVTCSVKVCPPASFPVGAPFPTRVSRIRDGVTGVNSEPEPEYEPATSTIRCVVAP